MDNKSNEKKQKAASKKSEPTAKNPIEFPAETGPSPFAEPEKPAAKKSRPKWLIPTIIAASVIFVLAIGGLIWYWVWWNSDAKVLGDARDKIASAKSVAYDGELSVRSGTWNDIPTTRSTPSYSVTRSVFKVEFDGSAGQNVSGINISVTISGSSQYIKVKGSAIISGNGDMYVKVEDMDKLAKQFNASQDQIKGFQILSDKWLKISKSYLDELVASSSSEASKKSSECVTKAFQDFTGDKAQMRELEKIISDSGAVTFTRVNPDYTDNSGALKYQVKFDSGADTLAVKDLPVYKSLQKCGLKETSFPSDSTLSTDDENTKIYVWIDTNTHEPTRASIIAKTDGTDVSMDMNFRLNAEVKMTVPANATDLKELIKGTPGALKTDGLFN